jgi:serine/threonine protein phosphatase PrpC
VHRPEVAEPEVDGGVPAPTPPSAAGSEQAVGEADFVLLPPGEQPGGTPVQAHVSPGTTPAPSTAPADIAPADPAPADTASSVDTGTPGHALRALIDAEGSPVSSNPPGAAATSDSPEGAEAAPTMETAAAQESPLCVACGTGGVDGDGYCDHCGHKQPRERDHMEDELSGVAAASDRGLRHHRNEDFFAIAEATTADGAPATIAVVCDGVSSATRPDEASAAAAHAAGAALSTSLPRGTRLQEAMERALVAAAEAVVALAAEAPNEPSKNAPACTIVSTLSAGGLLTVGWVGDSRAYWVPEDRTLPASRLTEDDSWAAQMVAAGLMEEDEAYADVRAHAITGWLGADAYEFEPHTASFTPDRPGVVVVCTDGLWNYAESAAEMAAAVPRDARVRPLHSARHLVGYALDGGGHDNVTVAVVPIPSLEQAT